MSQQWVPHDLLQRILPEGGKERHECVHVLGRLHTAVFTQGLAYQPGDPDLTISNTMLEQNNFLALEDSILQLWLFVVNIMGNWVLDYFLMR